MIFHLRKKRQKSIKIVFSRKFKNKNNNNNNVDVEVVRERGQ